MWRSVLFLFLVVWCVRSENTFDLTDVCFELAQRNNVSKHGVYCETVSADSLSGALPLGAKKINILNQVLKKIYENSFGNLVNIKEVRVNNCSAEVVQPGAFRNSNSIQIIDLRQNLIRQIKKGIFDVSFLKYIDISSNNVDNIEIDSFSNLPYLQEVNLSYNQLKTIYGSWFINLPMLSKLHFEHNLIELVQNHFFEKLNNNIDIFLSYNRITMLETEVFHGIENRNINKLYLDHNQITAWTDDLSINVIELKIDHNNITCFDGILKNIIKNATVENFEYNPYDCLCLKEMKTWTDEHGKHSEWFQSIYLKCRQESRNHRRPATPKSIFRSVDNYVRTLD